MLLNLLRAVICFAIIGLFVVCFGISIWLHWSPETLDMTPARKLIAYPWHHAAMFGSGFAALALVVIEFTVWEKWLKR